MNNLGSLNNYLFEQIERLNNYDLKGEELKEEMNRVRAINDVSKTIVSNANLVLQAKKFKDDRMDADIETKLLEG